MSIERLDRRLQLRDWAKWNAEHKVALAGHDRAMGAHKAYSNSGSDTRRRAAISAHRGAAEGLTGLAEAHAERGEIEHSQAAQGAANFHEAAAASLLIGQDPAAMKEATNAERVMREYKSLPTPKQ